MAAIRVLDNRTFSFRLSGVEAQNLYRIARREAGAVNTNLRSAALALVSRVGAHNGPGEQRSVLVQVVQEFGLLVVGFQAFGGAGDLVRFSYGRSVANRVGQRLSI